MVLWFYFFKSPSNFEVYAEILGDEMMPRICLKIMRVGDTDTPRGAGVGTCQEAG